MKKYLFIIIALVSVLLSPDVSARRVGNDLQFSDTLSTAKKRAQFKDALRLAPDVFVYDSIKTQGDTSVTVKGLKFNASMKNTLNSEFVESDPRLAKKLRKISRLTKPLNAVCDLTVNYHYIEEGIAVAYIIRNISIMGFGKVPEELE